MGLQDWLQSFKVLHDRAKRGELDGTDQETYLAARNELARAMLAAQRIAVPPGLPPRRALRVSRALQADLDFHDGRERVMTVTVSAGGFSAPMTRSPKVDDEATVALRISGDRALQARARVLGVRKQPGNVLVDFGFVGLDPAEAEVMETFLFDALLATLAVA